MPRHDFECINCKQKFELYQDLQHLTEFERCTSCGDTAVKIFTREVVKGCHTWKPFWHENLDTKPVFIESKRQLKEECKRRNFYCHGL